jgi:hypothetical protein
MMIKRGMMGIILHERSILRLVGLGVMETLKKLITFPYDMEGLTDPSFQCHLIITGQMTFK